MTKALGVLVLVIAVAWAPGRAVAGQMVVGLTSGNQLITFDPASPQNVSGPVPVTGLGGDTLVGIDFRPAVFGQLVGVGRSASGQGTVYTIDPNTGAAAPLVSGFALTGAVFGVDFNPVPDALRITSDTGQNLRIAGFPTGNFVVNVDGNLSQSGVAGSAYSNNFAGTTATTLYGINASTDRLVIQNPPNDGTLVDVGALGVNANGLVGFDIAGPGPNLGTALASLTIDGASGSSLYSIDLNTGAATLLGPVGDGTIFLQGMALTPVPEPGTLTLVGIGSALGLLGCYRRRKRAAGTA